LPSTILLCQVERGYGKDGKYRDEKQDSDGPAAGAARGSWSFRDDADESSTMGANARCGRSFGSTDRTLHAQTGCHSWTGREIVNCASVIPTVTGLMCGRSIPATRDAARCSFLRLLSSRDISSCKLPSFCRRRCLCR